MTTSVRTQRAITAARCWLADFALDKANETAERVGFGWMASSDAPTTYEDVVTEFTECQATGRDMRVGIANMIPSVFGSARATAAMRFFHHVAHVEMDADFSFEGEVEVDGALLAAVVEAGMSRDTLAWDLMRADTLGQQLVGLMTGGRVVPDPVAFAMTAVTVNLPFAVLAAVEQIEARSITGRDTEALLQLMEAES